MTNKNREEEKNNTTTQSYNKLPDITLSDIREAVEKIGTAPKRRWIEASKKHTKLIIESCELSSPKNTNGLIGTLYGVQFITRPYLKKVRLYTAK